MPEIKIKADTNEKIYYIETITLSQAKAIIRYLSK